MHQKSHQLDCWEELLHSVGFNVRASVGFITQDLVEEHPSTGVSTTQLFISTLIVANAIVIGLETDNTGEYWAATCLQT